LPLFLGAALEKLFGTGLDGAISELLDDNLQAVLDFLRVCARAVAAEEKLHDVTGYRILLAVATDQVLADEIAVVKAG
jgi:hypothetical protein